MAANTGLQGGWWGTQKITRPPGWTRHCGYGEAIAGWCHRAICPPAPSSPRDVRKWRSLTGILGWTRQWPTRGSFVWVVWIAFNQAVNGQRRSLGECPRGMMGELECVLAGLNLSITNRRKHSGVTLVLVLMVSLSISTACLVACPHPMIRVYWWQAKALIKDPQLLVQMKLDPKSWQFSCYLPSCHLNPME